MFKSMNEKKKSNSKAEKQQLETKLEQYRDAMADLRAKKDDHLEEHAQKKSLRVQIQARIKSNEFST